MVVNPNNPRNNNTPENRDALNSKEKIERDVKPVIEKLRELEAAATGAEKQRINHTMESMWAALRRVEERGANAGRFEVAVEAYPGNPHPAYKQFEGVPIDEAIKILKEHEARLAANDPQRGRYQHLYKKLEANGTDYYKVHYGKSNADVVSGRTPLTPEESRRQDLRNRHEAKLISNDYRKSTNPNNDARLREDYNTGQKVLNERIEYNGVELPKTVALVEASHSAETLARMRTDEEMNKLMTQGNFLKRFYYRAVEEGKKKALYEEQLRLISGKGKKYGWFSRNILRRKNESDEDQNLFRGTGQEAQHDPEMTALAKRFADDNIRSVS